MYGFGYGHYLMQPIHLIRFNVPEGYGLLVDETNTYYYTTEDGSPIAVELI